MNKAIVRDNDEIEEVTIYNYIDNGIKISGICNDGNIHNLGDLITYKVRGKKENSPIREGNYEVTNKKSSMLIKVLFGVEEKIVLERTRYFFYDLHRAEDS